MAMDDAFSLLLSKDEDIENLDKVEWQLENKYRSTFKDRVEKFQVTDFFDTIVHMIHKVIYEEHKKLNKAEFSILKTGYLKVGNWKTKHEQDIDPFAKFWKPCAFFIHF